MSLSQMVTSLQSPRSALHTISEPNPPTPSKISETIFSRTAFCALTVKLGLTGVCERFLSLPMIWHQKVRNVVKFAHEMSAIRLESLLANVTLGQFEHVLNHFFIIFQAACSNMYPAFEIKSHFVCSD